MNRNIGNVGAAPCLSRRKPTCRSVFTDKTHRFFCAVMATAFMLLAAGSVVGVMGQVPMQTNQDSMIITDKGPRLVINGQPVFISGMNLAWHNFGRDVGDTPIDVAAMAKHIKNIRSVGGNAMRWWLHNDAQQCPKLDDDGKVTRLGSHSIDNMRAVLDTAYKYGVVVSMCLFSHNLLEYEDYKANNTDFDIDRNHKFLTVPENLDSYIDNALIPILDAIGSHPAIMCWEAFNEPELMSTGNGIWGFTQPADKRVPIENILRFTNRIAGEVHRRTKKMASTGVLNFHAYTHLYSDEKLIAAGGDEDGWLDFYQAHHYPDQVNRSQSPFANHADSWGFDRPLLIGELPSQGWGTGGKYPYEVDVDMTIEGAYEYAYLNGYCGAMGWSVTEADKNVLGDLSTAAPALTYMYDKYRSDIEIPSDIVIPPRQLTGNFAMRVDFQGAPVDGLITDKSFKGDLSGKTDLTFQMYIASGSGTNLEITPAIAVGDGWQWCQSTNRISLADKPVNEWFTVTVSLSSYTGASENMSIVQSMTFQFNLFGGNYTGTIYIDNIKADGETIYNFNNALQHWITEGNWINGAPTVFEGVSVENVPRPGPPDPDNTSSVTFSATNANGNISAKVDETSIASGDLVAEGSTVIFTAIRNEGYRVKTWTLNGVPVYGNKTDTYSLVVSLSSEVKVEFEAIAYMVTHGVIGANGGISTKVDETTIASGDSVAYGNTVVFTAIPNEGYRVKAWVLDGEPVSGNTTNTYSIVVSSASEVTVEFEVDPLTSVLTPDRTVPAIYQDNDAVAVTPAAPLLAEFTAGPNPVSRALGVVKLYRLGKVVKNGKLTAYDASGNVVCKIDVVETRHALSLQDNRRVIAEWDLRDARGRPVADGTYLLRGVVKTIDGNRERVSVMVGVR